jgi:aspartate carbamoyltransferase regulatory subunit
VIDHIPSEKLFTVVQLLGVEQMTSNITIGFNLDSKKLGKKGIIKIADKFFCDEEINRISVVAPHVKLNIIRDYELVENEVTAYYNMTETGIPAFAAAPASLLIEENGEGWSENL